MMMLPVVEDDDDDDDDDDEDNEMMRMMAPLPLRATEAICPNNKNIDDGYENKK